MAEYVEAPPESVDWDTHAQTMHRATRLQAQLDELLYSVAAHESWCSAGAEPYVANCALYKTAQRIREEMA